MHQRHAAVCTVVCTVATDTGNQMSGVPYSTGMVIQHGPIYFLMVLHKVYSKGGPFNKIQWIYIACLNDIADLTSATPYSKGMAIL